LPGSIYPIDTKYAGPANAASLFHAPGAEVDTLEFSSERDRGSE
jgi:hypothetical protein